MQPRLSRVRFPPVPVAKRHDGWTPARQFRFIELLAVTRSITRACAAVGMSRESAYQLRDRPEAARGFALAWRRALEPDFMAEQRWAERTNVRPHPRAAARRQGYEVEEVEGPPN